MSRAAVSCCLVLACLASAPGGRAGGDLQGQVVTADGAALGGARVTLEVVPDADCAWRHALHAALAGVPASTITDADGRFVLAMPAGARALDGDLGCEFWLTVTKSGLVSWREPLLRGPRHHADSAVTLRPRAAGDSRTVIVEGAPAGAWLAVTRTLGRLRESRWLALPADGRCVVDLPALGWPVLPPGWMSVDFAAMSAAVVAPGVLGVPVPIDPDAEVVRLRAEPSRRATRLRLERDDGEPVRAARGLFRCPDRQLRWFALPAGEAQEAENLALVAVAAEGCGIVDTRGRRYEERIRLPKLPATSARQVKVQGRGGVPLGGLRVRRFPLTAWPVDGLAPALGVPGRELAVRDGAFEPPPPAAEPELLLFEAERHEPFTVLDPRLLQEDRPVELQPAAGVPLHVRVRDTSGAPVAGALLLLADSAHGLDPALRALPVTDAEGDARIACVPPGRHKLRVVADGFATEQHELQLARAFGPNGGGRPLEPMHGWLLTDSRGRCRVEDGGDDALWSWYVFLNTGGAGPVERDGAVQRLSGPLRQLVDVRVAAAPIPWSDQTLKPAAGRRYGAGAIGKPATHLVLDWTGQAEDELLLRQPGHPVIRVTGRDVAEAPRDGALARLDRAAFARRIPLEVLAGGKPLDGFRVETPAKMATGGYRTWGGDAVRRGPDGAPAWVSHDDGALDCLVCHPDFLPLEFHVAARTGTGPEPAIVLRAAPGARLTVIATAPGPEAEDWWALRVVDAAAGVERCVASDVAGATEPGPAAGTRRFTLPNALAPGKYRAWLWVWRGSGWQDREFEVTGTEPVTLDLTR